MNEYEDAEVSVSSQEDATILVRAAKEIGIPRSGEAEVRRRDDIVAEAPEM